MSQSEWNDFIKRGDLIWARIVDPSNPNGPYISMGEKGDITYQGYLYTGTASHMVFDQIEGSGKKTRIKRMAFNSIDVRHIGPLLVEEQD